VVLPNITMFQNSPVILALRYLKAAYLLVKSPYHLLLDAASFLVALFEGSLGDLSRWHWPQALLCIVLGRTG
jgi:hypothetical protein